MKKTSTTNHLNTLGLKIEKRRNRPYSFMLDAYVPLTRRSNVYCWEPNLNNPSVKKRMPFLIFNEYKRRKLRLPDDYQFVNLSLINTGVTVEYPEMNSLVDEYTAFCITYGDLWALEPISSYLASHRRNNRSAYNITEFERTLDATETMGQLLAKIPSVVNTIPAFNVERL